MCWPTRVDSYRPPAPRYVKETRYTRRYSPSPPPVRRIERTYLRHSAPPLPLPPPPPSAPKSKAPSAAPSAATSKAPSAPPSEAKSKAPSAAPSAAKSKAASAAPSAAKSKAPTEAPPPPASNAGSKRSKATYVEVINEDAASSVSSGAMSGAKSNSTHKSAASRRSSAPPPTEYSMHEKEREIRRYVRPANDWETYRYVDAPPPPAAHGRHRSVSSRRDSGAAGPRDSFDRELKISIRR